MGNNVVLQRHQRNQHTQSNPDANSKNVFKKMFLYGASISIGLGAGLISGELLFSDDKVQSNNLANERFLKKKYIEGKNPKYKDFRYHINLYQYSSCPYCTQIRKYLDYFGFNYNLIEVDSYSKKTLSKFTLARELPIVVLKDKKTHSEWHLTNSTAILSALESLRNEKNHGHEDILVKYLPTLIGKRLHYTVSPFKYVVSNSDINSVEWRRWINNKAVPAYRLNSINSLKNLTETFNFYSVKSEWQLRYPTWKYYYVYYSNALRTYLKKNDLLHRFDPNMKPGKILDSIIITWENGLGNKKFIDGNTKPSLADLAMYGTVNSYDGLSFFRKSLDKHVVFKSWYEQMQKELIKGEQGLAEINPKNVVSTADKAIQKNESEKIILKEPNSSENQTDTNQTKNDQQVSIKTNASTMGLQILSVNYLVHVVAFTFASWCGK